jgi:hypothetical protein
MSDLNRAELEKTADQSMSVDQASTSVTAVEAAKSDEDENYWQSLATKVYTNGMGDLVDSNEFIQKIRAK